MFVDQVALLALSALSALTLVSAQANSNSTFTIDPDLVDPLKRCTPPSLPRLIIHVSKIHTWPDDANYANPATWCNGQQDSCNTLCGSPLVNNCDTVRLPLFRPAKTRSAS